MRNDEQGELLSKQELAKGLAGPTAKRSRPEKLLSFSRQDKLWVRLASVGQRRSDIESETFNLVLEFIDANSLCVNSHPGCRRWIGFCVFRSGQIEERRTAAHQGDHEGSHEERVGQEGSGR